jgi:uncharacterized protein (DUF169 family)
MQPWSDLAARLTRALHLATPPIAITFADAIPADVAPFGAPMPEPTPDGRTGRVPAGCVFWNHAAERTFATVAADHGNCSVGSLTHGLIDLPTAAQRADVAALVESGWVASEAFPTIPVVTARPAAIVYGPLAQSTAAPDVVLVRTHPLGLMTITDAVPDTLIEGKPQCHVIAVAKEQQRVAASVGCALSRARTGMPATELACALPAARLEEFVDAIERAARIDANVARYAGDDATRFAATAS